MKLGIENKPKTWVAAGLAVVAILLGAMNLPKLAAPAQPLASAPATPTSAPQSQRKRAGRKAGTAPVLTPTLDPRLRLDLLKASENTEYQGSGRNIFRAEAEPPAPIPQPAKPPMVTDNQTPTGPPQPPPPPPIPLKFFGIASKAGEPKRALLADGEDVFVAKEGDIVDRHYKVNKIGVNSVEIIDVLNNNTQTIPLTAQG